MNLKPQYKWFLLVALFGISCRVAAQDKLDSTITSDSLKKDLVTTLEDMGRQELKKQVESFKKDRISVAQHKLLAEIRNLIIHAKDYLKNGIDTSGINEDIENLNKWYEIAGDGVFRNTGSTQTHRNLVTSYKIIHELRKRATSKKNQVDRYYKDLMNYRLHLDSLTSDSLLYDFSPDSLEAKEYTQQLISAAQELVPMDSTLQTAIPRLRALQRRIEAIVSSMNSGLEEIERYQARVYINSLNREVPNLWSPVRFSRPFGDIVQFSKAKVILGLVFYMSNNMGKLILLILFVLGGTLFLRSLKRKAIAENKLGSYKNGELILRHPFLSATFIILNIFQFIFYDPPFLFNFVLWIALLFCLTTIFRGFISKYWMGVWFSLVLVFLFACTNNLILQASRPGRWIMVSIAVAGIIVCIVSLIRGHRTELRERAILFFIAFVIFLELSSLVLNLSGRYNLSKALLVSGYINVVVGVFLIWTVRLIDEGLKLANEIYKKPDRNTLYINFERVGKKVPRIFYIVIFFGWLVIFGRNFYAFKFITEPLIDFLYDERTVGEFTFAIYNILIFFVVLVISVTLSKLVSFFASDRNAWQQSSAEKKPGIGSWVLLIRILIITMGIWIAMAAAGIPMDKAAIVFGALGVGIGLGLQSLVNNLVSGLIIAFEKPVNVGDIIEISGKSGTIRTIGFRSSIVNTWDGADVIIPNGDLLNAHLVNWTRGNTVRRVEIALGIAIGSDLDKVKELITELFSTNERVLKDPPPFVVANDFTNNSLNISIYFWVSHTREWKALRSEFIVAINKLLKENEIVFAIPQQDITVNNEPTGLVPDNKNEEKRL